MATIKKRDCRNYLLSETINSEPSYLNNARKKILQYLDKNDMSIRNFEQTLHLGSGAVSKFLYQHIRSISLETAIKVAEKLQCTVDELIGKHELINTTTTHTEQQPAPQVEFNYNQDLYRSISNYIFFLIDELHIKKIDLSNLQQTTINSVINKIYKFCYRRNLTSVHREFAAILLYKDLGLKIKPTPKN